MSTGVADWRTRYLDFHSPEVVGREGEGLSVGSILSGVPAVGRPCSFVAVAVGCEPCVEGFPVGCEMHAEGFGVGCVLRVEGVDVGERVNGNGRVVGMPYRNRKMVKSSDLGIVMWNRNPSIKNSVPFHAVPDSPVTVIQCLEKMPYPDSDYQRRDGYQWPYSYQWAWSPLSGVLRVTLSRCRLLWAWSLSNSVVEDSP